MLPFLLASSQVLLNHNCGLTYLFLFEALHKHTIHFPFLLLTLPINPPHLTIFSIHTSPFSASTPYLFFQPFLPNKYNLQLYHTLPITPPHPSLHHTSHHLTTPHPSLHHTSPITPPHLTHHSTTPHPSLHHTSPITPTHHTHHSTTTPHSTPITPPHLSHHSTTPHPSHLTHHSTTPHLTHHSSTPYLFTWQWG